MHDHPAIIFAALLIFLYGLFSQLSERSPITAPMVFVAVGIFVSPLGLDLFALETSSGLVGIITELTLILILFIDASTIDPAKLLRERKYPIRLLFIGLPLTILTGTVAAWFLFPDLSLWVILLVALILSPTDAALGQAVVKSEKVPEQIRRWVSVESGLNDGIVLPLVFVCIAALSAEGAAGGARYWIAFLLQQIVFGAVFGALIGWAGGRLIEVMSNRAWMNTTFQRLSAGSLALLCFSGAEMFHGNGFIAAFFGGLMLGISSHDIRERVQEYGEAEGLQLSLFVFLGFAMLMVPKAYLYWDLSAWIYALLSLTIIRMLPVAISLIGLRLGVHKICFIGWFGPRGIASVLYLLIVVGKLGLEGYEQPFSVIVLTVLLSVFLHGVSAVPLANRFASAPGAK